MRGIVKRFPGVVANDHVDLTIEAGEIHALLGENGAGKSTLMQVLYGFHRMDAGEIRIDGRTAHIDSPRAAIAHGIGMVHQEFMLVPSMTVVENTVLGLAGQPGFLLDLKSASRRLWALSDRHQLQVDPAARVQSLPIGVQQRVEILKLLYRDARLLILDEPTAVLTPPEKDRLFAILRSLRAEGRSVVIVTHKLQEIMEVADRVTVMRDGRAVATLRTADTTGNELARLMVGREVNLRMNKADKTAGDCVLRIADLRVRDEAGRFTVNGVSLDLHAGEIVGIAGVDGNGQSELARAILHLCPVASGAILLHGKDVTSLSVAQRRERGLCYIPADRRGVGSVAEFSIAGNAMLGIQRKFMRGPLIDTAKVKEHAQNLMQRFNIRAADAGTKAAHLSGGNLQKLILGREIMRGSKALVVEQPTRGLDAGAVEAVWMELLRSRQQGAAILLISAELEELLNLCDRIAVMYEGKIAGIVDAAKTDMQELGWMMTGFAPQPAVTPVCGELPDA